MSNKRVVNLHEDSIRDTLSDRNLNVRKSTNKDRTNKLQIFERKVGDSKFYFVQEVDNLVVYRGRNWLMQRAFNSSLTSRPDWHDMFISWFAVGTGGTVSGDPQTPVDPELTDTALSEHAELGTGTDIITVDSKEYKKISEDYFISDPDVRDDVDLDGTCTETDTDENQDYPCDSFLITKADLPLESTEGNGSGSPAEQYISELGIFISPSDDTGYAFDIDDLQLYARMTFSAYKKDSDVEIVFRWAALF